MATSSSPTEKATGTQGQALKEAMQSTAKKKAKKISTYVSILAGFSEMIKQIQKQFHLNFDQIEDELGMYASNIRDALYSEIITMRAIKTCLDHLEEIRSATQLLKKAKTLTKELKEKEIKINTPIPDLEYMTSNIKKVTAMVNKVNTQLSDLQNEQKKINETFLNDSKNLVNQIKKLLKEEGYAFTASELETNLIRMFSVLRHKMALEEKEKSGKKLSEAEKQFFDTADSRAINALLSVRKKSENKQETKTEK